MSHLRHAYNQETDDEEDDDSFGSSSSPADRIRRHYHHHHHHHQPTGSHQQQVLSQQSGSSSLPPAGVAGICGPETIQVKLNESYFARERRLVLDGLANVRQKVSSLRMFNPAKNESVMQQAQQEWNEKEKYTLDSLNDFRSGQQQKLHNGRQMNGARDWTHPQDGREIWPSKLQYFLAITSYSIGLGNVIRFPILVQKNGGLAFIIPFVIMLLLEGIPLFYLELAIGQRMRKAAVSCWSLVSPFAAGIGLASAAVSFLIGLYYNTMVAWTLIYTWTALTNKLPRAADELEACDELQLELQNKTSDECQLASAYEFQWYRETLNVTGEVGDWSHFNWPVASCLTVAWLISYLCLVRGLSSSKRLVYTISIFPYVILLVFLFKSLQLDGWQHGVRYLFAPDWPKLLDPFVWLQAAAQVFFSLGLGFGGLIALSSYNSINNNCYRDAVKVSLINFATSLLAGVVIFSILGFRAHLNHSKCQVERDQQINFYLADYNLKVLEHGAVFKQVHSEDERQRIARSLDKLLSGGGGGGGGEQTTSRPKSKKKAEKKSMKKSTRKESERQEVTQFVVTRVETRQNETSDKFDSSSIASEEEDEEFSAADAIDSITNLDRQLDLGSNSGSFDYGDADSEFILNASSLISNSQLEQIIEGIRGLSKCSIERELDESTRGTGLVFVVIAEAISQFDTISTTTTTENLTHKVNPFHLSASTWAILFFLMILALGFDSQFGNLEGLLSSLTDLNYFNLNKRAATADDDQTIGHEGTHEPNGLQHLDHDTPPEVGTVDSGIVAVRRWATGVICLSSLVISLVFFAHGAGLYMFAIFDEYASNFSLILIALFELLTISYIYPLGRFTNDCQLMTGKRPHFLILLSWRYISPILLLIVLLSTIKQFTMELDYEIWSVAATSTTTTTSSLEGHLSEKPWPSWAILFGSLLIICCVIWIPLVAMLKILLKVTLVPEESARQWFPAEELKEYHQISDGADGHQVTRLERILFGFADDYD